MTELTVVQDRAFTANEIRSQVNLIQEVMQAVMKKDHHYGVIPGCQQPSLYKPGAEKLLVTFRIAPDPVVEDLSTSDSARFRVTVRGTSIITGKFVGAGVGECSSDEEKYKWRKPVCDEEFNETPEDRRREVWKKYQGKPVKLKQVRTNSADISNTILKMADKRGYVALALKTTAASDIFTQDIEDLPEELQEAITEGQAAAKPPIQQPTPKAEAPKQDAKAEPKKEAQKGENKALAAYAFSFIPQYVTEKPGTNAKGAYVKYGAKDELGGWFGTFNDEHGEVLKDAKENGLRVCGTFKTSGDKGQFRDIVTIAIEFEVVE